MKYSIMVSRIIEAKLVNTRYGLKGLIEVNLFEKKGNYKFWLSEKQYENFMKKSNYIISMNNGYSNKRSEVHIVLEELDDKTRYIWCGVHNHKFSDLELLEEHFNVKTKGIYIEKITKEDIKKIQKETSQKLKDE